MKSVVCLPSVLQDASTGFQRCQLLAESCLEKLELYLITAWLAAAAALDPNCSSKPAEMSLFTKIIRKEIPSCKVGAGELWYAFLVRSAA